MGADIGRKYSGGRGLFQAKQLPTDLPQLGKEPLIHRSHEIARPERAPSATGGRANDALDELHVLEPPLRELLFVLEEGLGEKEENSRAGAEVQVFELDARGLQEL